MPRRRGWEAEGGRFADERIIGLKMGQILDVFQVVVGGQGPDIGFSSAPHKR
ncbi:MAG: hypothetical protein ACR2NZ_02430 [Rubripirellula sp.]